MGREKYESHQRYRRFAVRPPGRPAREYIESSRHGKQPLRRDGSLECAAIRFLTPQLSRSSSGSGSSSKGRADRRSGSGSSIVWFGKSSETRERWRMPSEALSTADAVLPVDRPLVRSPGPGRRRSDSATTRPGTPFESCLPSQRTFVIRTRAINRRHGYIQES